MAGASNSLAEDKKQQKQFPRTVVVGDLKRWQKEGRIIGAQKDLTYIQLSTLTAEFLADFQPEIILSPLVADAFDATDIAKKLHQLGFQGSYRALTAVAKDGKMVRLEIASLAPELDFDVLVVK